MKTCQTQGAKIWLYWGLTGGFVLIPSFAINMAFLVGLFLVYFVIAIMVRRFSENAHLKRTQNTMLWGFTFMIAGPPLSALVSFFILFAVVGLGNLRLPGDMSPDALVFYFIMFLTFIGFFYIYGYLPALITGLIVGFSNKWLGRWGSVALSSVLGALSVWLYCVFADQDDLKILAISGAVCAMFLTQRMTKKT